MADSTSELSDSQTGGSSVLIVSRSHLAEICQNMRPQLKGIAQQQTQNLPQCKDDPSDIVQGALEKACENIGQFKGDSTRQWRKWLIQIVKNQARDTVRRWTQQKRSHKKEDNDSQVINCLVDRNNETPSKVLSNEESRQAIDAAIASLKPEEQRLIRLKLIQDLSFREIAARLQVSEPTARRHFEAAADAFRAALAHFGA